MKQKFKSECPICHKKVGNRWIARHIVEHKKTPTTATEATQAQSAFDHYQSLLKQVEQGRTALVGERETLAIRIREIDNLLSPNPVNELTPTQTKTK